MEEIDNSPARASREIAASPDPRFLPAMRHVIEPANEQNLDRLVEELGADWEPA